MSAVYNEIEPFAADWLRELTAQGHIAEGEVNERSIEELAASDVAGPGQRHFFAGVGGWSYALRLAGIPDDANVWTGSCPCQPFSQAGARRGTRDPRHLWPAWFALIEQCRPPIIFGEQVASRDGLAWLDSVFADLERCGYAVGASDLCAAGIGAPHIRQRLYFVAYADKGGRGEQRFTQLCVDVDPSQRHDADGRGANVGMGDSNGKRETAERELRAGAHAQRDGGARGVGHPRKLSRDEAEHEVRRTDGDHTSIASGAASHWDAAEWILCSDGVARPIEPGTFPLAHGIPTRVGRLRAYGNAIVPQVAAAFVGAAIGARP